MAKKNIAPKGADLEQSLEQSFIQRNIKKIEIALGIVVVLVVAGFATNNIVQKRSLKAAEALFPCEQYFLAGNFDKALNGDGTTCQGFLSVASQYGCTKSGNLAKLYAGISYAQLGQNEEAKTYLGKFSAKSDQMISPAAIGALGNTLVSLGEVKKGAETLVKAAKKADNNVLSPAFLVQAGEAYESLGETAKALELYELVKSTYRASQQGQEIEKYIERAKLSK